MNISQNPLRLRRGIYLLPNLFTLANLFAGFYAIISAMNGNFSEAAISVFVAMILDGLDGRVARLTNTESAFGVEFDSLSDMVAFGVAPASIMYMWVLSPLAKMGWVAAFIYVASTALRLARFNTQIGVADKRYFQGLPCPAAALVIAGFVWVFYSFDSHNPLLQIIAFILTILMGLLMVSNIRYMSFKTVDWKGKIPFIVLLIIAFSLVMISISPPKVLFSLLLVYAMSGPILTFWNLRKIMVLRKRQGVKPK